MQVEVCSQHHVLVYVYHFSSKNNSQDQGYFSKKQVKLKARSNFLVNDQAWHVQYQRAKMHQKSQLKTQLERVRQRGTRREHKFVAGSSSCHLLLRDICKCW